MHYTSIVHATLIEVFHGHCFDGMLYLHAAPRERDLRYGRIKYSLRYLHYCTLVYRQIYSKNKQLSNINRNAHSRPPILVFASRFCGKQKMYYIYIYIFYVQNNSHHRCDSVYNITSIYVYILHLKRLLFARYQTKTRAVNAR